jgi:YebC/PmpR family DNA-binding regulatory protein
MSGHSKWSTIKHQKAAADIKRGKVFSRLAKAIAVAAKDGEDPSSNYKLRAAIEAAQAAQMPKNNIQRAIKKGAGTKEAGRLESIIYEGYGPEKIAVVVEVITDNKNRAASEIKSTFEKHGGSLGSPNAVLYLFSKKGIITVAKSDNFEEQALAMIDLGAEDFEEGENIVQVHCSPSQLTKLKQSLEQKNFVIKGAELSFEPKIAIPVENAQKKEKILNFLNKLDDLEDVQKVYSNVDFVEG